MAKKKTSTNDAYWEDYSNLQQVKHDLIRDYLGGWFPKLTSWSGKVVYFDTHAGRGRHKKGQPGSPLVALSTLLNHTSRDRILRNSEAVFFFIEKHQENADSLTTELKKYKLPNNVKCDPPIVEDCFALLSQLIEYFERPENKLAPAFFFIDPYGFTIPGSTLSKLMEFDRVEAFVNIIWRELDMAIQTRDKSKTQKETLNTIFDGESWRTISGDSSEKRANEAAALFREMTGAKWATVMRMMDNNRTRYFLMHLTNHAAGRVLMKDCMWKASPEGGFYACKDDNPDQKFLIEPKPDLTPLKEWTLELLTKKPHRWHKLHELLLDEIWRIPHLNSVIRELRKSKLIDRRKHTGKFLPSSNPELYILKK